MNKRYSIGDIKNAVQEILRQMHLDNFRPHYVVGITRGGLLPAKMISHYLKVPMHTLDISLRDNVQGGPESNLWMPCDAFGAVDPEDVPVFKNRWYVTKRKNILIIDDINDSGATLKWIKQDWEASCFPEQKDPWRHVWKNNVKFAVLVNNESSGFDGVHYNYDSVNKFETPDLWIDFPWESWWLD
jgi:hypoxanthine phosphoribosyltransferase